MICTIVYQLHVPRIVNKINNYIGLHVTSHNLKDATLDVIHWRSPTVEFKNHVMLTVISEQVEHLGVFFVDGVTAGLICIFNAD